MASLLCIMKGSAKHLLQNWFIWKTLAKSSSLILQKKRAVQIGSSLLQSLYCLCHTLPAGQLLVPLSSSAANLLHGTGSTGSPVLSLHSQQLLWLRCSEAGACHSVTKWESKGHSGERKGQRPTRKKEKHQNVRSKQQ